MQLRIATRQSELALWQARHVAEKLNELPDVTDVTLVPLSTRGDEILDRSLQKIGGKGLFIKELEVAMHAGDADIAVHSMKDVPADMPEGFCIGAVLERASPADALVSRDHVTLSDLPRGAIVGSSSLRRQAQLRALRPDLVVKPLRGNVATRLRKLEEEDFNAIVLASAGLSRLGLGDRVTEAFTPQQMLPAAAQGVVGIECLEEQSDLKSLLARLEHSATAATTAAEREVSRTLGASCQSPVAAYATLTDGAISVDALVAAPDGSRVLRARHEGPEAAAAALGRAAAEQLMAQGASELLGESDS